MKPHDCRKCSKWAETDLFELCTDPASKYTALGEEDYHTTGHMRTRGACGPSGQLFVATQPGASQT